MKLEELSQNTKKCYNCDTIFYSKDSRTKFCSKSCSATYNNKQRPKKENKKLYRVNKTIIEDNKFCLECNIPLIGKQKLYCSQKCFRNFEYKKYIQKWKNGKKPGIDKYGLVCETIKRYLREKHGNKCMICGWAKINPVTKKVPLFADHINGNWQDNTEENIRLLCGACDSIQPTYGALNKGKGRQMRYS